MNDMTIMSIFLAMIIFHLLRYFFDKNYKKKNIGSIIVDILVTTVLIYLITLGINFLKTI